MAVSKDAKSGKWSFVVWYTDVQGNRKQKRKRGLKTKKDAQDAERDFLNSLNHNGVLDKRELSVSKLIDMYLEARQHELKANTYTVLVHVLNRHIRPFFGKLNVSDINSVRVAAFHKYLLNDVGIKLSSAKIVHSRLIAMIRYAEVHYDIERISHKIKPPRQNNGPVIDERAKFYTTEQVRELVSIASNDNQLLADIIEMLYQTGLRIGELMALTYNHVDFDQKKLLIRQNATYAKIDGKMQTIITTPKTKHSVRDVLLTDKSFELISNYFVADQQLIGFSKSFYIFSPKKTTPHQYGTIQKQFKILMEQNDIQQITLHDLRHSHASLLINLGADALLVRDRLGHRDVTTTLNTYSHLFPERENSIVSALNEHLK